MRLKLLLITLLFALCCQAQRDTIEVSKNTAVMVFPSNISDAYLGDELEFYMDEKKKEGSDFAKRILKIYFNEASVKKKAYTSLLVITTNGNSYEFVLESSTKPKQSTWYISPNQAVTNILGKKISSSYQVGDSIKELEKKSTQNLTSHTSESKPDLVTKKEKKTEVPKPTQELYELDKEEFFRRKCYYNQFGKGNIPRFYSRFDDVFLWLKGVYYNNNEIYLQFRLENKEKIDFDLNFIKFSIATNYRNSSSKQNLDLEPIYAYKIPKRVKGNTENYFMVVFDKLTLDRKKVLMIDLDEEGGDRNMSMSIDRSLINNPKRF